MRRVSAKATYFPPSGGQCCGSSQAKSSRAGPSQELERMFITKEGGCCINGGDSESKLSNRREPRRSTDQRHEGSIGWIESLQYM